MVLDWAEALGNVERANRNAMTTEILRMGAPSWRLERKRVARARRCGCDPRRRPALRPTDTRRRLSPHGLNWNRLRSYRCASSIPGGLLSGIFLRAGWRASAQ